MDSGLIETKLRHGFDRRKSNSLRLSITLNTHRKPLTMDAQFGIAVAASADCGEKEQKKTARVDRGATATG